MRVDDRAPSCLKRVRAAKGSSDGVGPSSNVGGDGSVRAIRDRGDAVCRLIPNRRAIEVLEFLVSESVDAETREGVCVMCVISLQLHVVVSCEYATFPPNAMPCRRAMLS